MALAGLHPPVDPRCLTQQEQHGALTKAGFEIGRTLSYFEARETSGEEQRELNGAARPRRSSCCVICGARSLACSGEGVASSVGSCWPCQTLPREQFRVKPAALRLCSSALPARQRTTFAKAVDSKLQWPFVEVFPSRLAHGPQGLAGGLRETFATIAELDHVIVFIDEVEEIAAQRGGEPPSAMQGVTNELLKIIPAFRDAPGRLLICATNFIRALDDAFLRHGRFDYVIPIGLPDEAARQAIWSRYIPDAVEGSVDLSQLVASTDGYSPADIEFAARSASQAALEQSVFGVDGGGILGPSTEHYLAAISKTRATVSATVAGDFREDIAALART